MPNLQIASFSKSYTTPIGVKVIDVTSETNMN